MRNINKNKISLIVPTLNAGSLWEQWLEALKLQNLQPKFIMIVDSGSEDETVELAKKYGLNVKNINKNEFNHGATRQMAIEELHGNADIIIFMTQDAILSNYDSLQKIIDSFDDANIGAAYGRQLPHMNAKPLGAFAREYNYGEESYIYSKEDIPKYGIKTAFLSNSFAAYRVSALNEVGGFPSNVILGEDMVVAARMLMNSWCTAYVSDACVYHSHDYTLLEEMRRYFDIGVFHKEENWLLDEFGKPEGEGLRYLKSEMKYLLKNNWLLIPSSIIRTTCKFVGYKLGRFERILPLSMKKKLSMHHNYWNKV